LAVSTAVKRVETRAEKSVAPKDFVKVEKTAGMMVGLLVHHSVVKTADSMAETRARLLAVY